MSFTSRDLEILNVYQYKKLFNSNRLNQSNPEEYEEVDSNGLMNITDYAHTFLTSIKVLGGGRGFQTYIKFIRGSNATTMPDKFRCHPLHGTGKHKNDEWWKCIGIGI